jgi:hypothetical protein
MPYTLHRVFCATPGELEPERLAFHEVVGQTNEAEGMSKGILFVPVSIVPNMVNKLLFQSVIEENVQACRYFVQVLHNTWGPPMRNFKAEYGLACRLKLDPGSLTRGVSLFFKAGDATEVDSEILQLKIVIAVARGPHRLRIWQFGRVQRALAGAVFGLVANDRALTR